MGIISPYALVTTRRTCYGSCVSGAAAELCLKFCVSCDWLGSESDFAATAPATHVSCGRCASDAPNRTQNIPQRRHVQGTGAVPSQYLQQAFAVPPATCPYGGVRVCTSVARRRCVEGTTHVHRTHGHILPAQRIYSELITGIPEKFLAATKQLYEWFSPSVCPSVRLSVCLSVCHTFLTMFPSSYHHEIFRSYYQWQKWRPCKRSRSEVKGQGHRGHDPT